MVGLVNGLVNESEDDSLSWLFMGFWAATSNTDNSHSLLPLSTDDVALCTSASKRSASVHPKRVGRQGVQAHDVPRLYPGEAGQVRADL